MIVFPHAKVNLGLYVTGKESDTTSETNSRKESPSGKKRGSFHLIETVLFPIGLYDALEAVPAPDGQLKFRLSGLPISGSPNDNLCIRAYWLLKEMLNKKPGSPHLPPLHIHLHKCIPSGAGLGGGSSDAAFMLMMLNEQFGLQLDTTSLTRLASQLGSDCPFFLHQQPMLGTGRGNILKPLPFNPPLKDYYMVVIIPPTSVNTAEAYARIRPKPPGPPLPSIMEKSPLAWKGLLYNDFEEEVALWKPIIGKAQRELYHHGAFYASMTGTGSAVYGLFSDPPPMEEIQRDLSGSKVMEVGELLLVAREVFNF